MNDLKQEQVSIMAARIAELEAACAAKDAVLLKWDCHHCYGGTSLRHPPLAEGEAKRECAFCGSTGVARIAQEALSPDAGRDYVPRAELEAAQAEAAAMREVVKRWAAALGGCGGRDLDRYTSTALSGTAGRTMLDELRRLRRLRQAIRNALDHAGNRWSEWGERAEAVGAILEAAKEAAK